METAGRKLKEANPPGRDETVGRRLKEAAQEGGDIYGRRQGNSG